VKYADGLDGIQVTALLHQDLTPVIELVDKKVIVPLAQYQFDALVSFTFNVGNTAFIGSTLLKSLNAKLYDRVPEQLKRWVHDGGKVVKGLVIRRDDEIRLWLGQF
jgi:lysozyme